MKKVLSIVLSLVLVICMMPVMAFAGSNDAVYSDIAGEKCEGAVSVLSALGVVDGYENGTYKPEQTVTRAEMAKLVITALGMDSYATATKSSYSDMANAQWAIPVVEYATNLGIIEGVGGGRFSPGNPVTYEQAATMIVRAIGFTTACNEMNGTWPAIYVQKATALGIFKNVEGNKYGAGANRGDVAIMLYNALDLPEVYADKDGATHYKNGSEQFTINGVVVHGVSMLSTLNKDGSYSYKVVDESDADRALTNMRSYVGVAGKVVTNKDGDVLAVSDTASTLIAGSFDKDGTKFTAGDVTYSVGSKVLASYENEKSSKLAAATSVVPYFKNGSDAGTIALADLADKNCTISAKISGKTITQIWAVMDWSANDKDLFESVDATNIKNNAKLSGYTFLKDNNGDIDYTKFILEGVDSLDKIAEDNVVYVYADTAKNIRKVSVGTKTVTGEWTAYTNGNADKAATYTIDGTTYTAHAKGAYNDVIDLDGASVGDKVMAYLDYSGKVYEFDLQEGYSDYAVVLRVAEGTVSTDLNTGKTAKIRILTADGEYTTLEVNEKEFGAGTATAGKLELNNNVKVSVGDVIKYSTNTAGEVTKIENKTPAVAADSQKITASGYYDGKAIVDSAPIFVLSGKKDKDNNKGYSDDNAKVYAKSAMLDTKDVASKYIDKDGRIAVMVVTDADNKIASDDSVYGVITKISHTSDKDYPTTISVLVDGKETPQEYPCETGVNASDLAGSLVKITPSVDGKILSGKLEAATVELLRQFNADGNVISTKNNVIEGVSFESDVIVYTYDKEKEVWTIGDLSDVQSAKANTVIGLYENEVKMDDRDKVADIILVGDEVKADKVIKLSMGYASISEGSQNIQLVLRKTDGSGWDAEGAMSAAELKALNLTKDDITVTVNGTKRDLLVEEYESGGVTYKNAVECVEGSVWTDFCTKYGSDAGFLKLHTGEEFASGDKVVVEINDIGFYTFTAEAADGYTV